MWSICRVVNRCGSANHAFLEMLSSKFAAIHVNSVLINEHISLANSSVAVFEFVKQCFDSLPETK